LRANQGPTSPVKAGRTDGLALVDAIAKRGELAGSHLLPSIRGEMLTRLGRRDETSPAPMQHKSGRNN